MINISKLPQLPAEIRSLARHSSAYGLSEIIGRAISFFLIPVFTRYLSPSDYGIQELVGMAVEVAGLVLGLGLMEAVFRYYYDTHDRDQQSLVVSTVAVGWPIVTLIALAGLALFSRPLAALLLEGGHQYPFLLLAIGNLWFSQILTLFATYLRVVQRSSAYLAMSITKLILSLILNIYFVVELRRGVLGVFESNLIATVVFAVILYPYLLRKVGYRFSRSMAGKLLRFSLPIVPANLASFVVNVSDRYFIKAYFSVADVGIYSLGYKFGNIVFYLIRGPFLQIWTPRRLALLRDDAPPEIYAKVATYFIGLMTFVGFAISLFLQDLIKLMTPEAFWPAASYAPAVTLCYIVYSLDNHVGFGIVAKKKTEYWTYVNLIMAALNLLLNFLWIPKFGLWGAVSATFVSLLFKILGLHLVARKLLFVPFEWGRMAAIVGLAGVFYLTSQFFHPQPLVLALLWDSTFLVGYLIAVWWLGVVAPDEKRYVREAGRRLIGALA